MIAEFSIKTGISIEDILGTSRISYIAEAREMYYYILSLNGFRIGQIARLMDKSHCTVISGIKRIKSLLESKDTAMTRLFNLIKDIKR